MQKNLGIYQNVHEGHCVTKDMGYYHLEWERSDTFKAIISSVSAISVVDD